MLCISVPNLALNITPLCPWPFLSLFFVFLRCLCLCLCLSAFLSSLSLLVNRQLSFFLFFQWFISAVYIFIQLIHLLTQSLNPSHSLTYIYSPFVYSSTLSLPPSLYLSFSLISSLFVLLFLCPFFLFFLSFLPSFPSSHLVSV